MRSQSDTVSLERLTWSRVGSGLLYTDDLSLKSVSSQRGIIYALLQVIDGPHAAL